MTLKRLQTQAPIIMTVWNLGDPVGKTVRVVCSNQTVFRTEYQSRAIGLERVSLNPSSILEDEPLNVIAERLKFSSLTCHSRDTVLLVIPYQCSDISLQSETCLPLRFVSL